jgi:hypothetical protein
MTLKSYLIGYGLPAVMTAGFAFTVRLPHFFPYSDAAIVAGLFFLLSLSVFMMMPDSWLHSPAAILAHKIKVKHGMSDQGVVNAMKAIGELEHKAQRLHRALRHLSKEIKPKVAQAEQAFHDIATLISHNPREMRTFQTIIIRSEGVIEAVENQAKLRGRKSTPEEQAKGRTMVTDALNSLDDALSSVESAWVNQLLDQIDISSSTSQRLLSRHHKGN